MKSNLLLTFVTLSTLLLGSALAGNTDSKAPLLERTNEVATLFGKGDFAAMSELWTTDGHYFDAEGMHFVGRPAIASALAGIFSTYPGAQLRSEVKSTSFLDPDTIIEDGVVTVTVQGTTVSFLYTNINVRKDEKWLIASTRNYKAPSPGSGEHLQPLKGLIGAWQIESNNGVAGTAEFALSPGGDAILGHYAITVDGKIASQENPRIAWDAATASILSRSIEADGGFSNGIWSQQGDSWVIANNATMADGKKLASTNVIVQTGPDAITFQSKDRKFEDGEVLPDTPVIALKRVSQPKTAQ